MPTLDEMKGDSKEASTARWKWTAAIPVAARALALSRYLYGFEFAELINPEDWVWRSKSVHVDFDDTPNSRIRLLIVALATPYATQHAVRELGLKCALREMGGRRYMDRAYKIIKYSGEIGQPMRSTALKEVKHFVYDPRFWGAIKDLTNILYERERITPDAPGVAEIVARVGKCKEVFFSGIKFEETSSPNIQSLLVSDFPSSRTLH